MPEAFQARFPVSLVSSAFGRRNEAPRRRREKSSGTQGRGREATTRNTSAIRRLTPHKQTKNNKTMQTK